MVPTFLKQINLRIKQVGHWIHLPFMEQLLELKEIVIIFILVFFFLPIQENV